MKTKKTELINVVSFRVTDKELKEIEKMIHPPQTKSEFFREWVQIMILNNNK
jgi:hypothetical protein